MKAVFLEAQDIYLRPFQSEDAAFFQKWNNDAITRGKIGEVMPTSEAQAAAMTQRASDTSVWFAIVMKETEEVIGECGLLRMFFAWRTSDLTIIIPDERHQGRGYGRQAMMLLLDYAFGYLNFHRIAIGVVGFNTGALAFYKSIGFQQEGIQEDGYYYNYAYHDFIMMRILKPEFLQKKHLAEDASK